MSPEENKALIQHGIDALNHRDMERYFAMYAPTCVFYEPPSDSFGVERDGQNAERAFSALSIALFPPRSFSACV